MANSITGTQSVPCNGCTHCCKDELIMLHPESGDNPANYLTIEVVNPITGKPALALPHKADGSCVYLGVNGCAIHGSAPVICRGFDCGKLYEKTDRATRRRMVKSGGAEAELFKQGRRVTLLRQSMEVDQ